MKPDTPRDPETSAYHCDLEDFGPEVAEWGKTRPDGDFLVPDHLDDFNGRDVPPGGWIGAVLLIAIPFWGMMIAAIKLIF